jgi:hypothetical protein
MDVMAPSEQMYAVRYSPLTLYLGLGCQKLPDHCTPGDLESIQLLRYPTQEVCRMINEQPFGKFLTPEGIRRSQTHSKRKQHAQLPERLLPTDIGTGDGLSFARVVNMIQQTKRQLASFGLIDGIPLKEGGVYKGSVVEAFGFEDAQKRTSRAAVQLAQEIKV